MDQSIFSEFPEQNGQAQFNDIALNDEKPVSSEKSERANTKEIIYSPNFEFQPTSKGSQQLIIFVQTNPNLCYYYCKHSHNYFSCNGCRKIYQRKYVIAKYVKNDGNIGEEYIQTNMNEHICEPQKYISNFIDSSLLNLQIPKHVCKHQKITTTTRMNRSKNWEIINSQNYEIFSKTNGKSKLVIFDPNNSNRCYNYYYQTRGKKYICCRCANKWKKQIAARFVKNTENGKECLRANMKHFCESVEYDIDENYEVLFPPKFNLIQNTTDFSQTLIIFDSNNQNLFYKFTQIGINSFACFGCLSMKKRVSAKLENEFEAVVRIRKNQPHACIPFNCV